MGLLHEPFLFHNLYVVNIFSDLNMSCKIGFSRVRTKPHLLNNYKTGDFFDVMLAEIFSPSNFYVQVCSHYSIGRINT